MELVLNRVCAAGASRELEAGPEARPRAGRGLGRRAEGGGRFSLACQIAAPQSTSPFRRHRAAKERPSE